AFVSHHIGDLENYETYRSFTEGVGHFRRLFAVEPEVVAHDLHPEYLSTKYALEPDGVELEGVQHHHAHVAACLADNGEPGPVIGVAFDGLGYGSDGTIWGGELLVADLEGFRRAGHLETVPMPGGAAAIREPWRMAGAWRGPALARQAPHRWAVVGRNLGRWEQVVALARSGTASPVTSSAGRLFDAVAAILGVRDAVNYEGQAAVELEQLADPSETAAHPGRDPPPRARRRAPAAGRVRPGPRPPGGGRVRGRGPAGRRPLPQRPGRGHRRRLPGPSRRHRAGDGGPLRRGLPEHAPPGADGRHPRTARRRGP